LFLKARACLEETLYEMAVSTLEDLVLFDPTNEEGKKELARAQNIHQKYKDKESAMCKKMFS
jgi:hypothetical protein